MRVIRVACEGAVAGPRPAFLRDEQRTEPLCQLVRHAIEICQLARAGRAFDLKIIAVVAVVLSKGLDQQEIDWEPNGATPVRVPAHLLRVHITRHIGDRVFVSVAVRAEHIRSILIHAGQRSDAMRR